MSAVLRFAPAEGALLDLSSLTAINHLADAAVEATLAARLGRAGGLVLTGLDLVGEPSYGGPPGTRRVDPTATAAEISPGQVVLPHPVGGWCVLTVTEPVRVSWPTSQGAAGRGVLVVTATATPTEGALRTASEQIQPQFGFVRPDAPLPPRVVPLAVAVGNGRDWSTDHARVWQPEHPVIRDLARRITEVGNTVWRAEPEGAVWDRQVLGRNWVRYQTVAASAIEAALLALDVQAMTTAERVRLLTSLSRRLRRTVERAAAELVQIVGPIEGAGPYATIVTEGAEAP